MAASRYGEKLGWRGDSKQPAVKTRPEDPYRPPCPHYPHCIGCPLVDVPYPEQLSRKRDIVREAFAAFPSLASLEIPPVVPSPRRLGYRGRVKLVVRKNHNDVAIGLYVPGSHRVIDISSCPVHPRPVNQLIGHLKRKVLELGISPYDERSDSGDLRYVDMRYSFARREVSVTLISRHASLPQGEKLARSLQRKFPFVMGVIQNVNESRGNVIWGASYRTLSGRDTILERIGGFNLVFPAGVFSQANPAVTEKLYSKVSEWAALTGKETVVDLYCGVGPISLYLARKACLVWAIDNDELSIITAKQNARRNGISNCRFVAGDTAEKLRDIKGTLPNLDFAILNPPRQGVQAAAMEAVLELGAPKVIYVSCAPHSLARDLDRFVAAHYRIDQIQAFDMFPQTKEVETVVLLDKALPHA
ncbi:MAG TPA: 23S rRNA (uracil(1939)-C(5))-methyltransferase RlmD [Candidatus Binatia bacterium]|jgi:23S rRNA (uracil1939-C5)-methyltransferase|nr:23S rRNA (uracil(1939)-C(5))-methyltransferase RlmD [Candidatus Binatia bacterium]